MDCSKEVDGGEKAHAELDHARGDTFDGSHLATNEQMGAFDQPISSIEAPRPNKRMLMDPEELMRFQPQVNLEASPSTHVTDSIIDAHKSPFRTLSNTISSTPPTKRYIPSVDAARHRIPRCASCKRRKFRCNGGHPCARCQESKIDCVYTGRDEEALRTKADEFAIKALEVIEQRGRSRVREFTPPLFQDNDRALSHSPPSSFYHDDPEDDVETKPIDDDVAHIDAADMYQYVPLNDTDIRLLRIEPRPWQEPVHCTLKILPLTAITSSALEFQALSYAWAHDQAYDTVYLVDAPPSGFPYDPNYDTKDKVPESNGQQIARPFRVHANLYNALRRIRHEYVNIWIWVDALCIDQKNESEKSHQIPKMPDIYSNAWNVVVWLGDIGGRRRARENMDAAVSLIPKLLNLKALESMLRPGEADNSLLESWTSFMDILYRPWFTRRWVIQEIACARRLSLRIGHHVISWIDFADAVELFLDKLDRMRDLYGRSHRARYNPDALEGVKTSGARALMELSRNVFRKGGDSQALIRLMDLESLVLSTTAFAVTEVRDVIYALLHLANDITDQTDLADQESSSKRYSSFSTDYSRHPIDVFSDFVTYSITKSQALDIICRHWTIWPKPSPSVSIDGRELPSWIGAASCTNDHLYDPSPRVPRFSLVGPPQRPVYAASAQSLPKWKKIDDVLEVTGLIVGHVESVSTRAIESVVSDRCLRMLGWTGNLDDGLPDRIWRTLVANRTTDGRKIPGWYRRACALALTKLTPEGDLNISKVLADASQPSTLIEYLKRVQEVAQSRKFFRWIVETSQDSQEQDDHAMETETAAVGLGSRETSPGDIICILFGCSVAVILRPVYKDAMEDTTNVYQDVKLMGEAYVHDNMEGEILFALGKEELERRSSTFRIH